MNTTVKYIIIVVLQYPIYYILVNGLSYRFGRTPDEELK